MPATVMISVFISVGFSLTNDFCWEMEFILSFSVPHTSIPARGKSYLQVPQDNTK